VIYIMVHLDVILGAGWLYFYFTNSAFIETHYNRYVIWEAECTFHVVYGVSLHALFLAATKNTLLMWTDFMHPFVPIGWAMGVSNFIGGELWASQTDGLAQ